MEVIKHFERFSSFTTVGNNNNVIGIKDEIPVLSIYITFQLPLSPIFDLKIQDDYIFLKVR